MSSNTIQIKTATVPVDFGTVWVPHGWANGYVGVPPGHPWFGKDYDDIDADVHGGLTYARDRCPLQEPDGHWWVGFDTAHLGDDMNTCSEEYVKAEVQRLLKQALEAANQQAS